MAVRNFDTNTERVASFFDATTYFYGWKNSEAIPDDKDFKIKYDELYTAIRSGLASTAGLVNGRILFAQSSALAQDSNLFWDNTLKRLGVGTSTPANELHLRGKMTFTPASNSNLNVGINSGGNNAESYVIGINVVSGIQTFGGGNIFIANSSASGFGAHGAVNTIQIGGSGYAKTNTVALLGSSLNNNSVIIGHASSNAGSSNIGTEPSTIVGFQNTGGNTDSLANGAGCVVYGYQNAVTANYNNTSGSTAIVIGAFNTIWQNRLLANSLQKIVIGRSITDTQETVKKNSFGVGFGAYSFLHDLTQRNELYGGLLLTNAGYDQNSTNTKYLKNGTAPTTLIADTHAYYSADVVAGNAAPHFRTEAGNIVKLYSETTAVSAGAFVANTSGIVDDSATFGGYTIGQIVNALKNFGLLT